jgi:hypothetical protein
VLNAAAHCRAKAVPAPAYQLAAIWQMADRAQVQRVYLPLVFKN